MSANLTGMVTVTQSGGAPAVTPLEVGAVTLTPASTGSVVASSPLFEGIITISPEV